MNGDMAGFFFFRPCRTLLPVAGPKALLSSLMLLAASGGLPADDAPPGRVTVGAEPPVVAVAGLPAGRTFVDLPALEYVFEIAVECAGDLLPSSLSINVADTRVTLTGEELKAAPAPRLELRVPAKQAAPVAVDDFCPAGPPEGEPPAVGPDMAFVSEGARDRRLLEIPDVLSAQISLVCSDGEHSSMIWASQPLGVTLSCAPPTSDPTGPGTSGPAPAEP